MTDGSTILMPRLLVCTLVFGDSLRDAAAAQDRMPPIPADKLTPAQKQAVDEYKKARGGEAVGSVGGADTKSGTDVADQDAERLPALQQHAAAQAE